MNKQMRLSDVDAVANHLKERLIETALNNFGLMASADDVYRELSENRIDAWLNEMPTVDAVEVIRCKDCKHNPKESWFGCPMSHLSEMQKPDTAWCWKGERKDDETG